MVKEKTGKRLLAFFGLAMTLFFVRSAICQSLAALPDSIQIARVIVVGNVHTKTPVILRELEFHPGDTVSKKDLVLAKKRIENLYLFNRVQFVFLKDEGKTDLKIVVTERWYIFPIPILNFNEHSFSKISYGGGVVHYNFRGRAEKLFFLGWAGFNPGLKFAYRNDWFGGEKRYFTSFFLHSIRVTNHTNRFADLTSLSRRALLRLGRRFGIYRYVSFQTKIEQVIPSNPLAAIHSSGRDLWWQTGVFLKYDSRDLHEYPLNGYLAEVGLARAWLNQTHRTTQSFSCDIRAYRELHSVIFAGRAAGAFRSGSIPVYEHIFLGYDERIRGHFFESYEGENRILASAALRFALVPKRYYNLSRRTSSLKELEFAVYGTLFSDTGLVFSRMRELGIRHFQSGFGLGLDILLPYSNILRVEYAWNESLRGQFIFDGGVSF